MLQLELRRPSTKQIEVVSGEHLGIIRRVFHYSKFNQLRLFIHVSPEGTEQQLCMTYFVAVDWTSNSELCLMLAQLKRLPLEGDYLDPDDLVGIEVMVTTDDDARIHNIRAATEAEAARTDWDDEDDSLIEDDDDDSLDDDNQHELEDKETGYNWEGLEEPPLYSWQNGVRSANDAEPDWDALF